MIIQDVKASDWMKIGGFLTIVSSIVMGLFVLFGPSAACSFVSGLLLLMLGFIFITGMVVFLIRAIWSKKKNPLQNQ
jgi:hypothetical protein